MIGAVSEHELIVVLICLGIIAVFVWIVKAVR
jgi:Flp pilus assembly pilin Flp